MKRYQQYIMPVLCLIVVLAVWEFSVQFFGIDLYVLPAPSDIAKAIGSEFGTLWMHSMVTLQEDRKSTRLNSSHIQKSRMPSSA